MKDTNNDPLTILLRRQEELLRQKEAAQELCDMPMTQHYRVMLEQITYEIAELKKKREEEK